MTKLRGKSRAGFEALVYAAAGFVIAVGATNMAHAQSLDFLKDIRDFIVEIVDNSIWAILPGVYALVQLVLFAKTFQMPLLFKAVGGAAAAAIVIARWTILGRWGIQH